MYVVDGYLAMLINEDEEVLREANGETPSTALAALSVRGDDTGRLDWLERSGAMVAHDIAPFCWRVDVGETNFQRPTLRAAIDAAINADG
jgi:hypothetical protein